ncbi:MAG: HEAT repeat domain-containing protein [Anaerolineae bacterium]
MTKAVEKLLAYHMARLKDKNRQVRLQSIHELEQLEDPDALDALQDVFKNDPDPEVRKAAQNAGRTIFLKNNAK